MKLVGMLDSPYVRRVAISLQLLRIDFEHESLSVFSTFEKFRLINPVVKAPSLICDDGQVMMDSTLMIEYAEALAGAGRSLMPAALPERQRVLQLTGLALAACEKSISIFYERARPAARQHQSWVDRVTLQLLAACQILETELRALPLALTATGINQAGVSVAVGWNFIRQTIPDVVGAGTYPALSEFSSRAERLPEFMAAPHGDATYRASLR